MDREEPRRLERDRPRATLDYDGVEGQLVGNEGLAPSIGSVRDFEHVAADVESGSEAREEEAHVLYLGV